MGPEALIRHSTSLDRILWDLVTPEDPFVLDTHFPLCPLPCFLLTSPLSSEPKDSGEG